MYCYYTDDEITQRNFCKFLSRTAMVGRIRLIPFSSRCSQRIHVRILEFRVEGKLR
jgi:hypothetical protein